MWQNKKTHYFNRILSARSRIWTCVGTKPMGPKPIPFGHSGIPAYKLVLENMFILKNFCKLELFFLPSITSELCTRSKPTSTALLLSQVKSYTSTSSASYHMLLARLFTHWRCSFSHFSQLYLTTRILLWWYQNYCISS